MIRPTRILFVTLGLALMGMQLSGCTRPQGVLPNYQEDDLRERHLIKQQPVQQKLSIIPIGPKHDQISPADEIKIRGFIDSYQLSGLSSLTISYAGSQAAQPAMTALLNDINEKRVSVVATRTRSGQAEITLSYVAMQTVLDRHCGWSRKDGGETLMVPNKTMGCAFSTAFALQVEQPGDLNEPRPFEKKYYKRTVNAAEVSTSSGTESGKSADPLKAPLNLN